MVRERKQGCRKRGFNRVSILAGLLATVGAGCSDSGEGGLCATYACSFTTWLTEEAVATKQATQVDVHFCFDDDCRDGVIDLVRPHGSIPCVQWGWSSVCLNPTQSSGVYELSAMWDHQAMDENGSTSPPASKPADGSTYTLTLRDHASNAVLFARTSTATYVDGPNSDGCHPGCWSAVLSPAGADPDAGTPPVTGQDTQSGG